jgi:pyruvate dehydrogenase E1 component alpha subunit
MSYELSAQEKIYVWREMMRMRKFEIKAIQEYCAGRMGGFLHAQIGQEGVPVAIRSVMGPLDHSISSFRCLGHALCSGVSMRSLMAELMGRETGVCAGKSGMQSMHSPETRFWGGWCFAATQTPLACGLAFGLKYRGELGAVFCCLGDGAVNQGCFHEALNLASLFHLPVVFVLENNGFAMGTSVQRASAMRECLAQRAEGYAMHWDVVNADDFAAMHAVLDAAGRLAREQLRPSLIEVKTYRFEGFTIADANKLKYRSKAEVEFRMTH